MRDRVECGGGSGEGSFLSLRCSHSHPGPALSAQCLLRGEPEEYVCLPGASHKGCVLSSVCGPREDGVEHRLRMAREEVRPKTLPLFRRLLETSCSERPWESDTLPPSLALSRSQEPIYSEEASACIPLLPSACAYSLRLHSLVSGPDHSFPAGSSFSPGHGF